MNFFPSQAFPHLPRDVLQSFTNEQLQNLNIEQIQMIPENFFNSFNRNQIAIINRARYPFKSTGLFQDISLELLFFCINSIIDLEELIDINQKFPNRHPWNHSGRTR